VVPERHLSAAWTAIGTTIELRIAGGDIAAARAAVEREVALVDEACSRFREDSELSRLNRAAGEPFQAGELLAAALRAALTAAAQSDGAVDPTVGRALVLAGYDRDFELLAAPSGDDSGPAVVRLAEKPAWKRVRIDAQGIVRMPAGIVIDLGQAAKALLADRAAAAAAEACASGALVAVGGDLAIAGEVPAKGWPVHVTDDHRAGPHAPGQRIVLRTGALATSSTTVRRWSGPAGDAHHIIDPATGVSSRSVWRTASVAAANCVDANTAATAAIVKSASAPAWLQAAGLPARLVARDGSEVLLAGWPEREPAERAAA
jgi:thiamine biosynthesis lipoprotein